MTDNTKSMNDTQYKIEEGQTIQWSQEKEQMNDLQSTTQKSANIRMM